MNIYFLELSATPFVTEDPLMVFLPLYRQEKITKYYFEADKKLSFYSGLVLSMMLNELTGIPPLRQEFDVHPSGKPFVKNCPSVYFSLSHTKGALLCAVSAVSEIGADTEYITKMDEGVQRYVCSPGEVQYLRTLKEEERDAEFYRIWTRKEAYGKQNGAGICQDLKCIDTLQEQFPNSYCSWREGNYYCSVYGHQNDVRSKSYLTEQMVRTFYDGIR